MVVELCCKLLEREGCDAFYLDYADFAFDLKLNVRILVGHDDSRSCCVTNKLINCC